MIPAIFGYGLMQCQVRFLQTQNIVMPVMASAGGAAACHLVVCWVLVYGLGSGSKGAALSNSIAFWVNVALLAVYVRVSSACKETWTGFSEEAFRDALSFFRLGIPSALMVWYGICLLILMKFNLCAAVCYGQLPHKKKYVMVN
jgi:MATE family multidrug resistance protein